MRNSSFIVKAILALGLSLAAAHVQGQAFDRNPELAGLIHRVIAGHPSAAAARAKVEAARVELNGSKRARLPGLSVETSTNQRRRGGATTALAVEQPVWTGGRISASIREAQGNLDAALAALDEVYLDLALRTVQAYVDLQALRKRTDILDASVAEHEKLVDSMRRRVEQQISPASELMLAQSRMRQTEVQVLQTRASAEVALLRLRELTGADEVTVMMPLEQDLDVTMLDLAGLVSRAVRVDPQRRRIEAEADVAAAQVTIQKSMLLPQLGARYLRHLGNSDLEPELGLVLRFQSGGGFANASAVGAARQREESARRAVDSAVREQRERVMTEITAYTSALLQAQSVEEAVLAADAVTESFQRQFAAGRRTWPEVLNAVREAVSAELIQVDAESAAVSAYLRLMLISGDWPFEQQGEELQ